MIVNIFLFINYYLYFKIVTMVQKIKDTFSFVKAKIGGDQLDQKLVESVSEENWQTSTHILHQIANAAYNYQKWQRISEFIWDKLKKGKSWRKILKTLNLIEFLLKNGPQSVITNFKYDIYQLRTFQNYSHYSDGNDRGQPIRQRAKAVVNLLNNQQLLQEERVKAKTIRQKMSNVLGNSNNYGAGGYGGGSSYNKSYDNYDKGNKYDNYDKKKVSNKDNSYKYGNEGLGVYGDYTYNKSTLDKYKDKVNEPTTTANNYSKKQEEKKPEIIVQTKKPFQQSVSKLAKPGQKKPNQTESAKVETNNTNKSNNNTIINILDDPVPSSNYQQPQQPQKQPQQQSQQQFVQPQPQQSNNNLSNDLNFFGTVSTSAQNNPVNTSQQQQLNNNLYNQPNNNQPTNPSTNNQQPANQPFYPPQQQNPNFNKPIPQQNYSLNQQQTMYPQNNYNPMQYNQANLTGYQQPQMGYPQQNIAYQPNVAYQGQPYGAYQGVPAQQFQGQYNPYYGQPNQYGVNQAMGYGVGQVPQQQPPQIQANLNLNINLSGVNTKQQQQFGNFNGVSSASNVNWLSSKEKGLIDFSDFGSQIKNEQKQANKNEQINNNIKMDTWSW